MSKTVLKGAGMGTGTGTGHEGSGAPGVKNPKKGHTDAWKIAAAKRLAQYNRENNYKRKQNTHPKVHFQPGHTHGGYHVHSQANDPEGYEIQQAKKAASLQAKKESPVTEEVKHVKMQTMGEIKSQMFEMVENENGEMVPFFAQFVKNFKDQALKEPDSRAAAVISNMLLPADTFTQMDANYEKLLNKNLALYRSRVYEKFFKEQLLVLLDKSNRYKIMCAGRRSGKTQAISGLFVVNACEPKTPMIYIHKTFASAIKQMFDLVVDLSAEIDLPIERSSKADGYIEWKNGSKLSFKGNNDNQEADNVRGFKYRIAVIDEAAFQRNLRYLLDEALGPTLLDYGKTSQLVLASTPPVVPKTVYEHIWNEPGWTRYEWIGRQNPFIEDFDEEVKAIAERKGMTIDTPFIQREYYNQWIYDTEAEVFKDRKYIEDNDPIIKGLKIDKIIFGVDYGYVDYNSIVGLAYDTKQRKGHVFFEDKFNKSNVSQIAAACMRAKKVADDLAVVNNIDRSGIYFYADCSDQSISYEMVTQYGFNFSNAYKYNKAFAISQLAADLAGGNILIKKDGIIDEEMAQLIYMRDEQDTILPIIDEDLGIHPDAAMALLYAYRMFCFDCNVDIKEDE